MKIKKIILFILLIIAVLSLFMSWREKLKKPEKIKYIPYLHGERKWKVRELNKGHCPKVGDKGHYDEQIIYTVTCIPEKSSHYYYKTVAVESFFSMRLNVKEYKNFKDVIYLLRSTTFFANYKEIQKKFDRDRWFDFFYVDKEGLKRENDFKSIISDETYIYFKNKKGKVKVKYKRELEDYDKGHKLNGKKYHRLWEYDSELYRSLKDDKKAVQVIYQFKDFDNGIYTQLDKSKIKIKYPDEQLSFVKKLNINFDFRLPYYETYERLMGDNDGR